jgi:hypothetical protein
VSLRLIYQTVFGTSFLDLVNARLGGIVSTTEGAKTTADNLKNPLGGFDEYSKLLNELFIHAIFTIGKIFSMINKIKSHIAFRGINLVV